MSRYVTIRPYVVGDFKPTGEWCVTVTLSDQQAHGICKARGAVWEKDTRTYRALDTQMAQGIATDLRAAGTSVTDNLPKEMP